MMPKHRVNGDDENILNGCGEVAPPCVYTGKPLKCPLKRSVVCVVCEEYRNEKNVLKTQPWENCDM